MRNVSILQNLGYEVHYASNIYYKAYEFELEDLKNRGIIFHQITIARSPYMFRMNWKALRDLIKIIDTEKITLIHCHTPVGGLLGRLAGFLSKNKPKVIYSVHGFHFYKGAPFINNTIYQGVERILALLTDDMVTINMEDYNAACSMHLKKHGKVFKVPGTGVDLSWFKPVSKEERLLARSKIGIDNSSFFLLSVGELNLNKNHKTVIEAVKQISDKKLIDSIFLYGICGNGFFLEDTKDYVKRLGLEDKVIFFDYQKNVRDFYASADVTVFPSIREGLGMAGIESLAMGVPVIASDNRGTREYMQNGENGFVCQAKDVDAYVQAILKVYKMSQEEKRRMSAYCVRSVQEFSYKNTVPVMEKIYSSFLIGKD